MSDTNDLHRLGFKLKFVYSMTGLFLGLACIIAGVVLGLAGVAGHTSWTASALGLSTSMTDATPGVIIFVVGIFFVWMTRFKVRQITEHPQRGRESLFYAPQNFREEHRVVEMSRGPSDRAPETEQPESRTSSSSSGSSSGGRTVLDYNTNNEI